MEGDWIVGLIVFFIFSLVAVSLFTIFINLYFLLFWR